MSILKYIKWFVLSMAVAMVTACGGGGSSEDNNSGGSSSETVYTGKFTNVQGVYYETSSGLSGITTQDGSFQYKEGDDVSFYVDEVKLGSVKAKDLINLFDFRNSILVSQILYSIDKDLDFTNGLNILLNSQSNKSNQYLKRKVLYTIDIDEIDAYDPQYVDFLKRKGINLFPGVQSAAVTYMEEVKKAIKNDGTEKVRSGPIKALRGDYQFNIENEKILTYAQKEYKKGNYAYRVKVATADSLRLEIVSELAEASRGKISEAEELSKASEELRQNASLAISTFGEVLSDKSLKEYAKSVPKTAIKETIARMDNDKYKPELKIGATVLLDFASVESQGQAITALTDVTQNGMEILIRETIAEEHPVLASTLKELSGLTLDLTKVGVSCSPKALKEDPATCVTNATGVFVDHSLKLFTKAIELNKLGAGQEELNSYHVAFELWKANHYTNGDFCAMLTAYDAGAECEGKTFGNNFEELAKAIEDSGYVNINNTFFGDVILEEIESYYDRLTKRANTLFTKYRTHFNKFEASNDNVNHNVADEMVKSDIHLDIKATHTVNEDNTIDIKGCVTFNPKFPILIDKPRLRIVDDEKESYIELDSEYDFSKPFKEYRPVCGTLREYKPAYEHSLLNDTRFTAREYPFLLVAEVGFSVDVDNVVYRKYNHEKVRLYRVDVHREDEEESSVVVSYDLDEKYSYTLNAKLTDNRYEKSGQPYIYIWDIKIPDCQTKFYDDSITNKSISFTVPEECRNGHVPTYELSVYDKNDLVVLIQGYLEPYSAGEPEGDRPEIELQPDITERPSINWVNRFMEPYKPNEKETVELALGDTVVQKWSIQNTSGFPLKDVVFKWNSFASDSKLVHSRGDIVLGDLKTDEVPPLITLSIQRTEEGNDEGYYQAYHKVDNVETALMFENLTRQAYLDYKFSTKVTDIIPPEIKSINIYSNKNFYIEGSFYVIQQNNQVKSLRVHFSPFGNFPEDNSDYVDVGGDYDSTQSGGYKTFEFDASKWAGKNVYWKIEAANKDGYPLLPAPSGVVLSSAPVSAPVLDGGVYVQYITGGFDLSWREASGTVTRYELYRSTSSSSIGSRIYSGSSRSYRDTSGLVDGTTYYYTARACNDAGCDASTTDLGVYTAPITNSDPELSKYSVGNGPTAIQGEKYSVYLAGKDIDGDSGRLAIIWGDGTSEIKDISSISTSGAIYSFSHTYTTTGTFTWSAQLADANGGRSEIVKQSVIVSQ